MSELVFTDGRLRALDPILYEAVNDQLYDDSDVVEKISFLISKKIQTPFSIAVNGSWGGGKTTLLRLLQKKLEDDKYPTIWFNPWEYDNQEEDIVLALQRNIAMKAATKFKVGLKHLGVFALTLATASIDSIAKSLTDGHVSFEGVKDISEVVKEACNKHQAESFVDRTELFKKDFIELTAKVSHLPNYKDKPLIIFMDDLDRCLPENAIKILEALKNQFIVYDPKSKKHARVIFVSGIDTLVAKKFIKKRYGDSDDNFAINYFRKIFNLTIELPNKTPEKIKTFFQSYIKDLCSVNPKKAGEYADLLITLSDEAGMRGVRGLFNVINNYFTIVNTTKNELSCEQLLPVLVLKEASNDLYDQMCIVLKSQTTGLLCNFNTLIDQMIPAYIGNKQVFEYCENNVFALKVDIDKFRTANLFM